MCIHNHQEIYICISYTESLVAISIAKQKTGIDIEYIRPIDIKNVSKFLQNTRSNRDILQGEDLDALKAWTLKEAYCKLADQSMLACLNKAIDLNEVDHQQLAINNRYVLSVAFYSKDNKINICHLQKGIPIKMAKPLLNYI
ncbi:4'-phosphopantetheinyl transferase superfamily protein [Methanococcoides methylutens]|uniref:4'-phosphopantetheinyl transferase superfamily protein n=1 Tax=Methanococcoides methylutens TaxID=2226 RepID=UPI004043F066